MNENNLYWMNYSIDVSERGTQSHLRVGIVLVSEYNELICSAFLGEECDKSCCSILLNKVLKLKISKAQSVYMTINTLSMDDSFDLISLLNKININEIYIGLPDPTLSSYRVDDPVISLNNVYRYPDELQSKILEINSHYFADSKQSVKCNPYYSEKRISNSVINNLKSLGFIVSKKELNTNKKSTALATLLCNKYGIEYSEAISTVHSAISEAFNNKYAAYNYSKDTRSLDLDWKKNFIFFYQKSSSIPISSNNILNIGVGGGEGAINLFSNCTHITFVDIARAGLEKIKEKYPLSKIIVGNADNLSSIPDNSHDLYVSLRTYNSSFFDIKEAILEAHRVLKPNAIIIISVANGFLYPEENCIISGLIIPGTEFIDIYRSMDTIKLIRTEFIQAGFKNIKFFSTNTELYISAINA